MIVLQAKQKNINKKHAPAIFDKSKLIKNKIHMRQRQTSNIIREEDSHL